MGFFNIFNKKQPTTCNKMLDGIQSQMMLLPPDMNTIDFINLYGEVGYIYACINRRADAIASTDWYSEDSKGNKKESMALKLLKKPNPYMSQYELFNITSKYLDTVGQAFWYIARDNKFGIPREIWVINPRYVYVVPDKDNFIKGYVYRCGAQEVPLNTDDMLMFNISNPANPYSGVSPLKALASIVETEKYANEYNRNFFYNNATPNGIITYERQLSDIQFERVKEQWNARYGGVHNAHKIAILEGNAKYQTTGMSQKDMDFSMMKGLNKKEILGVFGVPEVLITGEAQNRATAEVQENIFYKNSIKPILRLIQDKINNEFTCLFKLEQDTLIKFREIIAEDKDFIKSLLDTQVNKTISVNEGRKIMSKLLGEDLEPVEGGDEIMTSPMTVPISIAGDYVTTGATTETDTSSEAKETEEELKTEIKKKTFSDKRNKSLIANAGKYQNAMLKASMKIEKEFIKDLNKYFKSQSEEIINAIYNKKDIDWNKYDEKLKNIANKHINNAFKTGGTTAANTTKAIAGAIQKADGTELIYTHANFLIEEAILKRCNKITRINATTKTAIIEIINTIYKDDQSLSIKEIENQIFQTNLFSKSRARTIAQTETLGAVNNASFLMMKQNEDVLEYKAWLNNTDELVRDAHNEAGFNYSPDNPIPLDEDFIVWGERASHPLDDRMSAKNVVNCRCCLLPIIRE